MLDDACKEIADLCVHCHMCRLECPANVDIPKLMVEAKASVRGTNGLALHDWFLARIDMLCRWAGRFAGLANWAIRQPAGALADGKNRSASPRGASCRGWRAAASCASRHAADSRTRCAHAGEKVVYFVDTYANYFDPQLAEALVAVLEHNGVRDLRSGRTSMQAGMPMISQGRLSRRGGLPSRTSRMLAEAVRQGYTIVSTEPSAVLGTDARVSHLARRRRDALLVAEHTQEACHYLWRLHQRGRLKLDFQPAPRCRSAITCRAT